MTDLEHVKRAREKAWHMWARSRGMSRREQQTLWTQVLDLDRQYHELIIKGGRREY